MRTQHTEVTVKHVLHGGIAKGYDSVRTESAQKLLEATRPGASPPCSLLFKYRS